MEETTNGDRKVKYDLLYILSPLLPEDKAIEEVERMRKIIETHGGTIFESDLPKLRPLAYSVAKTWEGKKNIFDQGLFGWCKFEITPAELPDIQSAFRTLQNLSRSAITYAYLDVRPVRRIPVAEGAPGETVVASLPPELVSVPTAKVPVVTEAVAEPLPRKVMSEAEIDKQIESLLA